MKVKMLVVDLEPTPYKYDLWNEFAASSEFDINVFFTTKKNYSPDGGHDYSVFPSATFLYSTHLGQGLRSNILLLSKVVKHIFTWRSDVVMVSGYIGFIPLISILICAISRIPYCVHSDVFNNGLPQGGFSSAKWICRQLVRRLIFRTAVGVLTCGKLGYQTSLIAGCPQKKIYDFPYVVDAQRILLDEPVSVPEACRQDRSSGVVILYFSGRMIPRKGLNTLISAVAELSDVSNWVLWIEGQGPELDKYVREARELNIETRCRFLGFCQMKLHSWLVRNSDVVVVPSVLDTWGIVVDEGMQMGKAVIASDGTGSGADRIIHDSNGLVFAAGNSHELSDLLRMLISNPAKRVMIGDSARRTSAIYNPKTNVRTLCNVLGIIQGIEND